MFRLLPTFIQRACTAGVLLALCPSLFSAGQPLASANSGTGIPIHDRDAPKLLTASIYSHDGGAPELLYRFKRTTHESGSNVLVLREFSYPDGRLAARETVVYEKGAF